MSKKIEMNKIKFYQKLLFKVFLAIFLVTTVTLIVAGALLSYFTGIEVQHSIKGNELEIAKQTMNKIDHVLYERYLDVQAIAGESSLEKYLADDLAGVVLSNEDLKKNLKRIESLSIVTGPWNRIFIIDKSGTIILSTDEGETGKPLNRWYYKDLVYQKAMKGKANYTDFVVLKYSGESVVVFAAPIRDTKDPMKPIIGAVVADLPWEVILQVLEELRTGVLLLNQEGEIIGSNNGDAPAKVLINQLLAKAIAYKSNYHISTSLVISRQQGRLPEDMLVSLAVQQGYLSYEGSRWAVALNQPLHSVFALANQSAVKVVLILTPIILLMSGFIAFFVNQFILKPLAFFTQAIDETSSGNLKKLALISSKDEIGQLAVSFNVMTTKLRESYENLEEKIKQRTSALRESEDRSRSIIETANDAFISMDEEGLIRDWNHAAETIFGWLRLEVIGKTMTETIIPHQYREAHIKGLKHFLSTGKGPVLGKILELTALHRDGREFPIEITIWSILINKKYQFNAFIKDITERKNNENTLRATFEDLQKVHEEHKQTQMQLLQSEKLASIGQLAAGVAHEINNPVGFISNNMELLGQYVAEYTKILRMLETLKKTIEDGDMEKARSIVKEISQFEEEIQLDHVMSDIGNLLQHNQRGIERIQKIVMDLRTFAREDGDTLESVKIEEVIDSILSIVHSELKYKSELKKSYGDTPLVKCNPQRLGQVFINLFVNAAQAIEEKGIVEVKTYIQDKFICVDVSDTGKGIPSENLSKIFDAFFTTKPVGQGTGLGLSVSYEIIKKQGGDIKVRSKVGEGTTFTVMLPFI